MSQGRICFLGRPSIRLEITICVVFENLLISEGFEENLLENKYVNNVVDTDLTVDELYQMKANISVLGSVLSARSDFHSIYSDD